jgi:rSAM/selenodomain-associated transferase 2
MVSVIIPAWRETDNLSRLLSSIEDEKGVEVIVTIPDGDKLSKETASRFDVMVVSGSAGRGAQLAKGASTATGEIFIFCHADTELPTGWRESVINLLAGENISCGVFRLRFDAPGRAYRVIEFVGNLRSALLGLPYGDQTLFTTRRAYYSAGGFKPMPLMEDVDMVRRLSRLGRVATHEDFVKTSARRYEKTGLLKGVAKNYLIIILYMLGVSPATLAKWYRRDR